MKLTSSQDDLRLPSNNILVLFLLTYLLLHVQLLLLSLRLQSEAYLLQGPSAWLWMVKVSIAIAYLFYIIL